MLSTFLVLASIALGILVGLLATRAVLSLLFALVPLGAPDPERG